MAECSNFSFNKWHIQAVPQNGLHMLAMNGKQHVGGIPSPLHAGGGLPGRYSPTYRPDGMRRMGNGPVCMSEAHPSCSTPLASLLPVIGNWLNAPNPIYYLPSFIFYEFSFYPACILTPARIELLAEMDRIFFSTNRVYPIADAGRRECMNCV